MKTSAANLAPWVLGSAVAFAGVGLVRLAAPAVAPAGRIPVALAGFTLALLGLFIIARGVSRRIARQAAASRRVPTDTLFSG